MSVFAINQVRGAAQQIVYGDQVNPIPHTVTNTSTGNANLWWGYNQSVGPNNLNESSPLAPGGYITLDGSRDVWAVADAAGGEITVLPGVTNFFLPGSLESLGGIQWFNQATAPTGTIATNSIWNDTANGTLYSFIGGNWVQLSFNAQDLVEAGTIIASLIAAGTIVTGIVNGTIVNAQSLELYNQASPPPAGPNGIAVYSVSTGNALGVTLQQGAAENLLTQHLTDGSVSSFTGLGSSQLSKIWSVPANDAQVGTTYRLELFGTGNQNAVTSSVVAFSLNISGTTYARCAVGLPMAAADTFDWYAVAIIRVINGGSSAQLYVTVSGVIEDNNSLTGTGFSGFSSLTLNTTNSWTFYLQGSFNTQPGTMTSYGSTYERTGT